MFADKPNTKYQHVDDPIVIVGAACRLAGEASSLDRLWDMMKDSRTALAKVPKERWDADALYHPNHDRKGSVSIVLRNCHHCVLICAA